MTQNRREMHTEKKSLERGGVKIEYLTPFLLLDGGLLDETIGAYRGNGGIYRLIGDELTFEKGGKKVTIQNYQKKKRDLGIALLDPITITIDDDTLRLITPKGHKIWNPSPQKVAA
jgi:hypothetical protein